MNIKVIIKLLINNNQVKIMTNIKIKRYCNHCGTKIPIDSEVNFCNICVELRHCKGCSILLRDKKTVNKLIKNCPNYKFKSNISPVDERFCIDCYSEFRLRKKIKTNCFCGNIVTEDIDKLDYFIKNGNFCEQCLERVRNNLKSQ